MIKRLLIANRGDIAVRIIRTCKELNIETIAIYSEIDKDSLHRYLADESICIGPNNISKSYNNIDNIIYLAKKMNCDAIHPGFGFLSENVNFAKACLDNDIVFVGPTPNQIELMGNKSKARETMISLNVPVVPGSKSILKDKEEAKLLASSIGYPVMIKASSGGGGKGMRIIFKESEFDSLFDIAKSEALASFGDSSLYMEKYIENPRHIEVQVFGDSFNNAIHLGDRDCSMQRRNQKVIEESLSHYLDEAQRKKLYETSIAVIKGIGYLGAGTIEFIVDKDKNFYFIEMNTRIQVEHPVTEMITGIDLIKLQLLIASGEKIPFKQEDVKFRGHAIECRINAEDAENDFKPSPGKVESLHIPGGFGVRFDTFIYTGYTIPPIYDSMLGKLICIADTRDECISRMDRALDEIIIEGITSNIEFQRLLINSDEFKNNTHHTKFIETSFIKSLNA
ncbi:acetyl-CoA carboxylase subunit,Biotin carboxylase,acetyl-CoA carboxylase biotin carboxylase subunit,Acetyl/propionyl-CoA carboxylase, alpha subunit,acetyl-CoA carboxylase, biotin carboxylase subunit,Carbamoyl-phosphate synthase L chain, ATP binding domain [[Clostridium] sordellii]|uniref:acetyl-CoA carboxylase biotin carboxylase subunit n=1 Tax=Paraclostridium sordellii TaxID=1505 RepID=UPI000542FEAB|nr:acetyl-CoA carboxylase biotin carboxylase subunit [Paeniclostridium sordellii]CEK33762.1 acetyl-CoA carboxylase subunit,Biotin carboxylase,acetyl-CoA carboxylase biotin carboxylase subunit,Acetyl/propionyl-CoA carboxylase, alpha subunit,acetyl-CoA carboxylase, biotin carboxylase subunit,Carbamoyl-phosphate synthase L chain, ATP binding domain [[Clostridium] sordellii] [Paeniclostridium sordellii]